MRHQKAGLKLNRTAAHRQALFRNLVTALFTHGKIRTTDAKAKEIRRWADKMVTLAKRGDLHARRQALAVIRDADVVHALFDEANERFGKSSGGYTRLVKIGIRKGDCAPVTLVELTGVAKEKPKEEEKKKRSILSRKKTEAKAETKAAKKEETPAAPAEAPAEEPAQE
ncbi:MAG: 50S ribosomal protein L17 [Thermodesulfobacteriota bacterium]